MCHKVSIYRATLTTFISLSFMERMGFLLSQLDGLTYAQVALQLGVTDRTVKRYMAQAFAQCILLAI